MLFSREMIFDRLNNVVNIALSCKEMQALPSHVRERKMDGERARGFSLGFCVTTWASCVAWRLLRASFGFSLLDFCPLE